VQYGDRITVSDVIEDTHEDPVLQEAIEILGEQAAQMIEKMRYGVLKAGLNVMYANGATRNAVNTAITLQIQRRAVRTLKRQNARPITSVVRSTPGVQHRGRRPGFVALVHPDLRADVRSLTGFVPAERTAR
jgi:N4-gp56 family major capsid protein